MSSTALASRSRFGSSPTIRKLIAEIPESEWESIPIWREGAVAVAEIPYAPFGGKQRYRLIVRRFLVTNRASRHYLAPEH